jgi:hypothetical protein
MVQGQVAWVALAALVELAMEQALGSVGSVLVDQSGGQWYILLHCDKSNLPSSPRPYLLL